MKLLKKVLGSLLALTMVLSPVTPVMATTGSETPTEATITVTKTQTSTQKQVTIKTGTGTTKKKSVSAVKGVASNGATVSCSRASGHKCLSVNSKGTVYVAKGTKSGRYYIWVSVKSGNKTVKVKLSVKVSKTGAVTTSITSYKA